MSDTPAAVRTFDTAQKSQTVRFGDREIFITPAVEKSDGRPLSTYTATFGRDERADLPAPYDEVWVVMHGRLRIRSGDTDVTVGTGDFAHIPEDSPGEVEAIEATTLVCVSVPAH